MASIREKFKNCENPSYADQIVLVYTQNLFRKSKTLKYSNPEVDRIGRSRELETWAKIFKNRA